MDGPFTHMKFRKIDRSITRLLRDPIWLKYSQCIMICRDHGFTEKEAELIVSPFKDCDKVDSFKLMKELGYEKN